MFTICALVAITHSCRANKSTAAGPIFLKNQGHFEASCRKTCAKIACRRTTEIGVAANLAAQRDNFVKKYNDLVNQVQKQQSGQK
jgi:hypothetical protein